MTGKFVMRSLFVVAIIASFSAAAVNSAAAANYYLDVNGTTAGDGIALAATYTWSTAVSNWSNANAAGTGPIAAWTVNNTNVAFFGGMTGPPADSAGWNYTMAVDSTVGNQKGGINVGSVSSGTVTLVNGTSTPNFYNGAAVTWTIAAGSTMIDSINSSNGAVNLNGQALTLTGGGNLVVSGSGLDHENSTVNDNLTGILTLNTSARSSYDATCTFNLGFGTLNLGNVFGLGSAKLVIGSSTATVNLDNTSGAPMTLTSTGAAITISNNFNFLGSNNLTFAGNSPVTLTTTPTITVVNNTLTIPDPIGGPAFGINKAGAGKLALTGANTYGGGTAISAGTVTLGAAGSLGSGSVSVQSSGVLDLSAYAGAPSISGSLNINAGGTLTYGALVNANGGLSLNGGTLAYTQGNQIAVTGGLALGGVSYVVPNAVLAPGTYPLFTSFVSLSGGSSNLALGGSFIGSPRQTFAFDTSSGTAVNLVVSGSIGNLQWTGGTNSAWDTGASQSWFNMSSGSADVFYSPDSVTFNDTPGTATNVTINGTVQPGSVTFSNAAVNYTFGGTGSIVGPTSLQIAGPGALTINNSNSYTGGTNFAGGGVLNLGNPAALGSGPLTIAGGALDNTSGSAMTLAGNQENWNVSFTFLGSSPLNTGTGAVTLNNSPTVTVNAGTLTVGGVMSGASALSLDGAGVLLLTASNLYNGSTTVFGGTLQLGTGQAGQDGSINATGSVIDGGALVYDLAGNQTAPYKITSIGTLTKLGSGNLTLTATSSLSGPTSVNGGTLTLQGPGGGNGTLGVSPLTVASGAYLNLNNTDVLGYNAGSANIPVTIYGTMSKINIQSETLFRPIILSGGTMSSVGTFSASQGAWNLFGSLLQTASGTTNSINGSGALAVRVASSSINLGAGSTLNISAPISEYTTGGTVALNVDGPGTLILSGTNTDSAWIQIGYNATATNLTFPGNSAANFTGTGDGTFQVAYGSTVNISSGASVTLAGNLKLGSNASGSSGSVFQNGGSVTISDSASHRPLTIGEYDSETSSYNLSAGALTVPNGWTYLGWSGSGDLNISGGSATLAGINFGGNAAGGALNLSGNGVLSIGSSGIVFNKSNSSATSVTVSGGTLAAYASWATAEPMTLAGPATIAPQVNAIALAGALSGSGNLTLVGPGTLQLAASNGYSGGTTVVAAGLVQVGNNNALGSGPLTLAGGGISSSGVAPYSLANPLVISGSSTLGDSTNFGALAFTTGSGTLAANTALTVRSPVTIFGSLGDGGGGFTLTKAGAGPLTLAGNNTYSGSTTISGGALYLNGANATPSIFVSGNTTLGGSGTASSVTVDNSGNLDLSQNATSTFTLASLAFNSNTGTPSAIYLPVFTSTSSVALQTGAVNVNGGGSSVQFHFPNTPIASGNYRLLAYSGAIGGVGVGFNAFLVVQPPLLGSRQTASLQNNPHEIDYNVGGFTPYWNGQQSDWLSTNAWTLSPGGGLATFQSLDNDVFDDSAGSGAFGTAVNINQGNVNPVSVTFNNSTSAYAVSGSNGITGLALLQVNGGGGLTISNSNSYFGGTQLNAGVLNINNPSAIGTGPLTISGPGAPGLGNTSGGSIALATNNAQSWNADFTFNGPYDLNLGTGAVTLGGSRTVTLAAGNLTVGGPIGGSGASLTVKGSAGLLLAGANTYNGGTLILGGTVTASDNNSPLGSGPVAVNPASGAATLNLTGSAATIGALTMSPSNASATVFDGGAGAATIGAVVMSPNNSGTAALTLSSAGPTIGAVTMSPDNNSTATLTITGSAVSIPSLAMTPASGAATVYLSGAAATVGLLSNGGAGTSSIILGSAVNSSPTTLTVNTAAPTTFSGTIGDLSQTNSAAVGSLVSNGPGTLTLSGSNTNTGSTTIASGVLQLGSATALYAGASVGNAIVNGTLDLNGYNAGVAGLSGAGVVLSSVSGAGTLTAGYNNASSTFSGTVQASLQGLTKSGSGVLTLTGAENAPAITISGGTLQIGNGGTTGSIANAATVVDNGALVYNLGAAVATLPSGGITGPGTVTATTAGNIAMLGSVATGGSQSYNATIATHARGTGVEVGGPTLAGAATYTLSTTAAGSSITLTGDVGQNAASPLQNLVVDTSAVNGTINLNVSIGYAGDWFPLNAFTVNAGTGAINWAGSYGTGQNQGPLSLTGAINFSSNFVAHSNTVVMILNPSEPSTVSGAFSGPMSVVAGGPGVLTFTNLANTYTGNTTISGGTLQLGTGFAGQDGAIAGTSGVIDNAALAYNLAGSQTASYAISGSGSLTLLGTGTLTLAGLNTYSGGTTVASGTLIATNVEALADGSSLTVGDATQFPAPVVPAAVVGQSAVSPVPEPGTMLLAAFALGGAAIACRRRRRFYRRTSYRE